MKGELRMRARAGAAPMRTHCFEIKETYVE